MCPSVCVVWMNTVTMDKAVPPCAKIGLYPVTSLQLSVGLNSLPRVSVCLSRSFGVCRQIDVAILATMQSCVSYLGWSCVRYVSMPSSSFTSVAAASSEGSLFYLCFLSSR
jgi:hypothetical protein